MKTQTEKDRAEKKVQIAIDKLIDLQGMGFCREEAERILDALRHLETRVRSC
jgi:hypothetical protein